MDGASSLQEVAAGASGAKPNAAIVILTQNTPERKVHLSNCLYFLFKHFNAKHAYPVILFHEGDYDAKAQREILMGVRSQCRHLVTFHTVDAEDFQVPSFIDEEKMKHCIEARPTPYWRNAKYRCMCRWWLVSVFKYVSEYEYIMRLDDDSIIEEPIPDLFAWAKSKDLNYASNFVHVDCGICCYDMKNFFLKQFPEKASQIEEMFMAQEIPSRSVAPSHFFRLWMSITQSPLPEIGDKITVHQPIMMYNNFFVLKTAFWKQPAIQDALQAIDETGMVFYARWGDAPLQSLLAFLNSPPEQISRAVFAYSKRMQRGAFKGDDGEFYAYMPDSYEKTSCITDQLRPTAA